MHLVDGAVSAPVLAGGAALAAAGVALGLARLSPDRLPQAGVLGAAFFVASLIHVPVGVSSAHLILNGLIGLLLGWAAFPVIFIALVLQAVFFGFGGLLVLGVNTVILALPAVLCGLAFAPLIRSSNGRSAYVFGAFAGALAILGSGLIVGLALALTGEEFLPVAKLVILANLPIMVVEGVLTGAAVVLLRRVKPEALGPAAAAAGA